VVIYVDEAPVFATGTANGNTGGSVTFIAGQTNSSPAQQYNITAIGFPAPVITELGFLPPGVTFSEVSSGTVTIATFTNTAAAGSGGNYDMLIAATNSLGTATIPVSPNNTLTSFDFVLTVDQQAGITSAGSVTFTAGTPSSYPIIASGFPAPTISFTGSLPSGVTFIQSNGIGTLAGTPAIGTGGTYQIVFTATNGILTAGTQAFVLTVDQNPVFSASTPATVTFAVGDPNTYQVDTTGFPIASLTDSSAPAWLTFVDDGNGDATLSGTPPSPAATYTFTITAAGSTTVNETFTLITVAPSAPAFIGATSTVFPVLGNDSFDFSATGFPVSTFSLTSGTLPSGVTLSAAGVLAGTPLANAGGTYALTITATNGVNPPATELFNLYVTSAAPTLTFAPTATFTVGSTGSFVITATGAPVPAITELGTLPSGLTFVDNGNGTADLFGTPAAGSGNVYDLAIQASNGVSPSASNVLIVDIDQAPSITSGASDTFTAGTAGTFDVTATGFPTPSLSVVSGSLPPGVTLTDDHNGTAVLAGVATTGGTYDFTLRASNGTGSGATQSFVLTVDQSASFTSASTGTLFSGTAGSIAITTSGFPFPSISETGLPAGLNLSFTDEGDGTASLSGTATPGHGGVYTITLSAVNVLDTATQVFTLDLDQQPAFISTAAGTASVGTGASLPVDTSGFPTATISLASGSLPSGLSITNLGSGQAEIVGTPATGTGGTYNLVLSASNGVGPAVTEGYALTIDESAAITSPSTGAGFVVEEGGTSFTFTSDGFPAPTFSISPALPDNLSLVNNGNGTATIEGTPAAGTQGTYFFTVTATSTSSSTTQNFELIIATPSITLQSGVLTITGTADSDTCTVATSATEVLVSIDGISDASFPIANVNSVVIVPLAGNDQYTILGGVPMTSVEAGTGSDTIIASNSAPDTIYGGDVGSSIVGGSGLDFLDGGSGNATIVAGSGNESIFSGTGNDSLTGGPGADMLKAEGPGNTTVIGGTGNNTIKAVSGNDSLVGSTGAANRIKGGTGHDTIVAASGASGGTTVKSVLGFDSITANNGEDNLIKAMTGFDTVVGAIGSTGMDTIVSVQGDSIDAGPRDDSYSVVIT